MNKRIGSNFYSESEILDFKGNKEQNSIIVFFKDGYKEFNGSDAISFYNYFKENCKELYIKRMMNLLFICNQGQNRSKTAAELFNGSYCGIYSQNNPLTKEKLEKADIIFTMEESQRKFIAENFPTEYLQKKIINLDIPDIYSYNDPKLIKILKSIVTP